MKIGFSGLGRMGANMTARLLAAGHEVVVMNRSPEPVQQAVALGATSAESYRQMAEQMQPAVIWLMLPEDVTSQHVNQALEVLPSGSVLINGANSRYTDSLDFSDKAAAKGVRYLDVGTSGGILGREKGYALMIGGDKEAAELLQPILDDLAPKDGWAYLGPAGSGHYVKMVHNAIEYGMMESLAEGYRLIKEGPYKDMDLAKVGDVWQHGSIVESLLNDLTRQALHENASLEGIDGVVAESGETRWSLEIARQLNLDLPAIQAAFEVRLASQKGQVTFATKLLAAMRNKFGGHALNPNDPHKSEAQK